MIISFFTRHIWWIIKRYYSSRRIPHFSIVFISRIINNNCKFWNCSSCYSSYWKSIWFYPHTVYNINTKSMCNIICYFWKFIISCGCFNTRFIIYAITIFCNSCIVMNWYSWSNCYISITNCSRYCINGWRCMRSCSFSFTANNFWFSIFIILDINFNCVFHKRFYIFKIIVGFCTRYVSFIINTIIIICYFTSTIGFCIYSSYN